MKRPRYFLKNVERSAKPEGYKLLGLDRKGAPMGAPPHPGSLHTLAVMSLPVPLPSSKDADQQLPRTTLLAHFEAFCTTDLPERSGTRPAAGAPHRAVPGRGRGVPSPGELYPQPRHGAWLCRAAGGDKHTARSHEEQSHAPQERTQALPGVICWHHAAAHIQGSPKIFRPACFSFLEKRLTWLKGAAVKPLA